MTPLGHQLQLSIKYNIMFLNNIKLLCKLGHVTQLFRYANANRCHVQRWTVEYFHINKWKPLPFPLISPPRNMSASFHFYESKEGNKHSLKLIKWWVHSHIFHEPEKGGVRPRNRFFYRLFYESDGSKVIRRFMFKEFEMTKKTPKRVIFRK